MSLLNFPPLDATGRPYALQEYNGRILTGSRAEFEAMAKTTLISDFPHIERQHLSSLQHCLSKDDMKGTFVFREQDKLSAAYEIWNKEGASGVVEHLAHATETSSLWPLSRAGRAILKVRNGISSMAQKMITGQSQASIEEKLLDYSTTLNWKHNWIRCVAWHADGKRMAICQNNDYIRVYCIGADAPKAPLTLRHVQQKNVSAMSWQLFDQRVLAVAAGDNILIWRLNARAANIKVSMQNAQVISVCNGPLNSLFWDRTSSQTLITASPNANKMFLVDATTNEVESVGAWTGGNITGLYPSEDGQRIAVTYTGNCLRVYDRTTWREEKWSGLAGRATSVVWSPTCESLMFATENDARIFCINFTSKTGTNAEGQLETRWSGSARALPVFDVSPIEFDPSEAEIDNGIERELVRMGGAIHHMCLSKDAQRLAVHFRDNTSVVALFIVEWRPTVQLIPSGLIEAPLMGDATLVNFAPRFDSGSLLTVVWSGGVAQYIPLIYGGYGHHSSSLVQTTLCNAELSSRLVTSPSRNVSMNDSRISSELPSGVVDTTRGDPIEQDENTSGVILYSQKIRTPAPTRELVLDD